MPRTIFVNLPVTDVVRSAALYEAIGFAPNPAFTDPQASTENPPAAALSWSDTINVMLLGHAIYSTFTSKPIADTREQSAVLLCLSCTDRDEVDAIARAALAAGAGELHGAEDEGFMYSRAFQDFDGHAWQVMWLDPEAMGAAMQDAAVAG